MNSKIFLFFIIIFLVLINGCEVYHGNGVAVLGEDLNFTNQNLTEDNNSVSIDTNESNETNETNTSTDINQTVTFYLLTNSNINLIKNQRSKINFTYIYLEDFEPQELNNSILYFEDVDILNKYIILNSLETGRTILNINRNLNINITVKN
jgi:hypothetical protein